MTLPAEASFLALDLKSVTAEGAFEGYASLFNREDLGRDVILPGAFTETLQKRPAGGVRLLFQHDPAEPIGVWEHLQEDARGLFARGRLALDVGRAREVHSLMRAGAIDGLSIGFKALKTHRDRARGRRLIEKIDLWEISIVTFPMLPEARIVPRSVRGRVGAVFTERELERALTQDAGLSRSQARALMRHGFKGVAATQAAAADPHPERDIAGRLAALVASVRSATPLS
ncbi:MAG: HK97 family phage prohead protease [Hyphomicrobiaceae bacterium]